MRVDYEMRQDCLMWSQFLEGSIGALNRPFVDFAHNTFTAEELDLFSDASAVKHLGMDTVYGQHWVSHMGEDSFIDDYHTSIKFLELYAVTVAILL